MDPRDKPEGDDLCESDAQVAIHILPLAGEGWNEALNRTRVESPAAYPRSHTAFSVTM